MKVKEFIEKLKKENPEDEIHIWVDDEVGCGAGEFGKYYASDIGIWGRDKFYQNKDGDIRNMEELEEIIYDTYDDIDEYGIKNEVVKLIKDMKKLEGLWIYIQP
jgi:hypothetical protein